MLGAHLRTVRIALKPAGSELCTWQMSEYSCFSRVRKEGNFGQCNEPLQEKCMMDCCRETWRKGTTWNVHA